MIEWYKITVFENYANFSGRARRTEYWYFRLLSTLSLFVFVALGILLFAISGDGALAFSIAIGLFFLYSILILIPSLAVTVRRMHDIGKSGWTIFVAFIPLAGPIWFLVLLVTEGNYGENYYGLDPKATIEEIDEIGINN